MGRTSTRLRRLAILGLLGAATLSEGCASSGARPRPVPTPGPSRSPGASGQATPPPTATVVHAALALRGTPYRSGGADPNGFDCSGFTQYVFGRSGVTLPREVRDQFRVGRTIKPRAIEPGDLLFFSTVSRGASHVGIAISRSEFVHAPSSKGVVRVEHLTETYWARRFVGARRLG